MGVFLLFVKYFGGMLSLVVDSSVCVEFSFYSTSTDILNLAFLDLVKKLLFWLMPVEAALEDLKLLWPITL